MPDPGRGGPGSVPGDPRGVTLASAGGLLFPPAARARWVPTRFRAPRRDGASEGAGTATRPTGGTFRGPVVLGQGGRAG